MSMQRQIPPVDDCRQPVNDAEIVIVPKHGSCPQNDKDVLRISSAKTRPLLSTIGESFRAKYSDPDPRSATTSPSFGNPPMGSEAHKTLGMESPTHGAMVRNTMKGIRRTMGTGQSRRPQR